MNDPMDFDAAVPPSWALGTDPRRTDVPRPSLWRFDTTRKPILFPGNRHSDAPGPALSVPPQPVPGDAPGAGAPRVKAVAFWVGFALVMLGALVGVVSAVRHDVPGACAGLIVGIAGMVVCGLASVLEAMWTPKAVADAGTVDEASKKRDALAAR